MTREKIEALARWFRERGEEIPGFGHVKVTQGKCFEVAEVLEHLLDDADQTSS